MHELHAKTAKFTSAKTQSNIEKNSRVKFKANIQIGIKCFNNNFKNREMLYLDFNMISRYLRRKGIQKMST